MRPVDEAVIGRLLDAIGAEDRSEEEQQLNGVLRMLGAETPDENQTSRFSEAPVGQAPKP